MKIRSIIAALAITTLLFATSCVSQRVALVSEDPATISIEPVESSSVLPISWETTALLWRGEFGHRQHLLLPPGGSARAIYGSGTFRYDSSIGSAAVSMNLITFEQGGTVTIEIQEGPEYSKGDTSQVGWSTVFVFLDAEGKPIMPPDTIILHIPDPDEPIQATETLQPAWFTVMNATGTSLTYLDIYTNDMLAVDEIGYNLLADGPLAPGDSVRIVFSDHRDLEEAILWRYGQLFHVLAEDDHQTLYYREWYPSHESLDLKITADHRYATPSGIELPPETIRVENLTDYALVELYILTPEMEEQLDFNFELLGHQALPGSLSVDIDTGQLPYLHDYLTDSFKGSLLVIAYDEDDYMLVKVWYPAYDPWVIMLTYDDYYE